MQKLLDSVRTLVAVTDLLHTHLTLGLEPPGVCPACDQHRADVAAARRPRELTAAAAGQSRR